MPGVRGAKNQCLYLTCEASYFRDEAFEKQANVLALFQLKSSNKLYYFKDAPVPLTVTPQKISFRILYNDGKNKCYKTKGGDISINIAGTIRKSGTNYTPYKFPVMWLL